jgi:phosphoenolpyruvate carboxylase
VVREKPEFVEYFRQSTPEQAWAPAAGQPPGQAPCRGIEKLAGDSVDLRLDPDPPDAAGLARLGAALSKALERGEGELLAQMREQWPFFRTRIDMLEMVLAKADATSPRPTTSVWCSRSCHWVRTCATYCRSRARWCWA